MLDPSCEMPSIPVHIFLVSMLLSDLGLRQRPVLSVHFEVKI